MKKILHIEDDKYCMDMVRAILNEQKDIIIIDNIRTITQAMTELENNMYDIIIIDGNLLDGSSMEIILWLIKMNISKKKVFLHSGCCSFLTHGQKNGFTNTYSKGSESKVLLEKIAQIIK